MKRATIDAVLGRLGSPDVDLANLVLDLHDGAGNKRAFAQERGRAMADLGTVTRPGR